MNTGTMTPLERSSAEEIVEEATPEELLGARQLAQQEWLEAARVSEDIGELRFELSERLRGVQQEEGDTLQHVVTEALLASQIAELEEVQGDSAVSPHQLKEKIREEIAKTTTAA